MKLPSILRHSIDNDTAVYGLVAPGGMDYFKGHFPGSPVLPGVVQIGWCVALAMQCFERELEITGMRRIKFTRLIRPDTPFSLDLALLDDGRRLRFRYHDDDGDYSSGMLDVEAAS